MKVMEQEFEDAKFGSIPVDRYFFSIKPARGKISLLTCNHLHWRSPAASCLSTEMKSGHISWLSSINVGVSPAIGYNCLSLLNVLYHCSPSFAILFAIATYIFAIVDYHLPSLILICHCHCWLTSTIVDHHCHCLFCLPLLHILLPSLTIIYHHWPSFAIILSCLPVIADYHLPSYSDVYCLFFVTACAGTYLNTTWSDMIINGTAVEKCPREAKGIQKILIK